MHGLCIDELHAHRNRKLYDALLYSGAARRQPMSVAITTAGDDTESLCHEQHVLAKKVIAGEIEQQDFFGFIAAADAEDDWTDPKSGTRQPSLGHTIDLETFAVSARPRGCRRSGSGVQKVPPQHLGRPHRERVAQPRPVDAAEPMDARDLEGLPCYGGLDLGAVNDFSAFTLLFPRAGRFDVLAWFWLPRAAVEARGKRATSSIRALSVPA
jgi:phage terminase large subunit-like protein